MNFRTVWVVFNKEMTDAMRDRRTWLSMIVVPILLIPVMLLAFPTFMENQHKQMKARPPAVALVYEGNQASQHEAKPLVDFLHNYQASDGQRIELQNPCKVSTANARLSKGEVRAIVVIPADYSSKMKNEQVATVGLKYDSADMQSSVVRGVVEGALNTFQSRLMVARLKARGIDVTKDQGLLNPIVIAAKDVVKAEQQGGNWLGMIMPLMLGAWVVTGGMYSAIDAGAGEKERGTLEPLLATPPTRFTLVFGKYLTVLLTSTISAIMSVLAMYGTYLIKPSAVLGPGSDSATMSFSIPIANGLMIVLMSLAMAASLSAVQLAISVFARSFKEAQSYLTPVTLIIIVPGMFTEFMGLKDITSSMFHIPLVNYMFCFKELLMGVISWDHLSVTLLWSVVYVVLSMRWATSMFKRESVLFRG